MIWLIETLLANAIVAMPLAVLAWMARPFVRRPAVQHALWVIVLVKLVTPPLVPVRVPVPASWGGYIGVHASSLSSVPDVSRSPLTPIVSSSSLPEADLASKPVEQSTSGVVLNDRPQALAAPVVSLQATSDSAGWPIAPIDSQSAAKTLVAQRSVDRVVAVPLAWLAAMILIGAWVIGSLVWWGMNARQVARFGHYLRGVGLRDRQLERRVGELAARLGLNHVPQIHVIDMGVAPMLWGCGKWTKIVLPLRLMQRLDNESRDALLLHELAHFRRGDQWVRLLELLVIGLYWWHPIVWWAKRHIAEYEEECCDALAVAHSPAPRRYADVLLDTLDFIADYRLCLVPASSAISDVPVIERRLRLIMTGGIPWSLSNWGRFSLICLVTLLPYQPLLVAAVPIRSTTEAQQTTTGLSTESSASSRESSSPVDHAPVLHVVATAAGPNSLPRDLRLPPITEHPLLETGPTRDVWGTVSSVNGRFELMALSNGRVHLRDGSTDRMIDMTAEGITAAAFLNRDHLLAGTKAGAVRIYDAASGAAISFLGWHRQQVVSVSLMWGGRRAVTASGDGSIFVWDLEANGAILHHWNVQRPISLLRPSPDGRLLAVACGDWFAKAGVTLLMDFTSGQVERELPAADPVGALAFRSNAEMLLTTNWDGRVTFWNLRTGEPRGYGRVEKDIVSAASFSPDDTWSQTEMTDAVQQTESEFLGETKP